MASRQHPSGSAVPFADHTLSRPFIIHERAERTNGNTISTIPTFIIALDVKTNTMYSSPAETYPGKRRQTGREEPGIESLIPLDRFKIQLLIRRTIRTGKAQKEEFRIHVSNGETRTVESETAILLDGLQQVSKVIVITRDITLQNRMQLCPECTAKYRLGDDDHMMDVEGL